MQRKNNKQIVKLDIGEKFSLLSIINWGIFLFGSITYFVVLKDLFPKVSQFHFKLCGAGFILFIIIINFFSAISLFEDLYKLNLSFLRKYSPLIFQLMVFCNLILLGYAIAISGGSIISPFSPFLLITVILLNIILSRVTEVRIILILSIAIFFLSYFMRIEVQVVQLLQNFRYIIIYLLSIILCLFIAYFENVWIRNRMK